MSFNDWLKYWGFEILLTKEYKISRAYLMNLYKSEQLRLNKK